MLDPALDDMLALGTTAAPGTDNSSLSDAYEINEFSPSLQTTLLPETKGHVDDDGDHVTQNGREVTCCPEGSYATPSRTSNLINDITSVPKDLNSMLYVRIRPTATAIETLYHPD